MKSWRSLNRILRTIPQCSSLYTYLIMYNRHYSGTGAPTCYMPTPAPLEAGITKNGTLILAHTAGTEELSKNVKLCLFHKSGGFTRSLFHIFLLFNVKIALAQAHPEKWTRSLISEASTRTNGFRIPAARESRQFLSPPRELS